jgi:hypothetical protein
LTHIMILMVFFVPLCLCGDLWTGFKALTHIMPSGLGHFRIGRRHLHRAQVQVFS